MNSLTAHTDLTRSCARQVLTFRLGDETFGIDILRVKEIRGWSAVSRVPESPAQVLGVLNLRGAIVPIIDLRVRFKLPSAAFTPLTVIVVIAISTPSGAQDCGVVVDSVSDVVDLEEAMIRPPPQFSGSASGDYIESLAAMGDRMVILLSTDGLVGTELQLAPAASASKRAA